MLIYISINSEGVVQGYGSTRGAETDIEVEVTENHEVLKRPFIYKYVNGSLIKEATFELEKCREGAIREIKKMAELALTPYDKDTLKFIGMQRIGRLAADRLAQWDSIETSKQTIRDKGNNYESQAKAAKTVAEIKAVMDSISF